MPDRTQDDIETLRSEIAQLRSDISAIAGTVGNIAARTGDESYRRMKEAGDRTRGYARQAGETVEQQIEERPFTSVLVSFVTGLLLGILVQRRS